MQISFFTKDDEQSKIVSASLRELLLKEGHELNDEFPEIVISVGGDGTFLRAAHHYLNRIDEIIFIGVHTGTLGFFADYDKHNYEQIGDLLNDKSTTPSIYPLLQAKVTYEDSEVDVYAINEIRIETPLHTLIANVEIDGTYLQTFRGNGLNVSTVLGSSGYNRSLGGAIIDNTIQAIELSEIAGIHSNAYRSLGSPLVLNANRKIFVKGNLSDAIIGYDHLHLPAKEAPIVSVLFKQSDKCVRFFHYNKHTFIDTLKQTFVQD